MSITQTRDLMNKIHLLMESKYDDIAPLKYISNKYINGKTYSFEKMEEDIKYSYTVSFSSSPDMLKSSTSDIHYQTVMEKYKEVTDKQPKYLMSFRAPLQKGKIFPRFEDEVNLTVSQIIKDFSLDYNYLPHLIILDPIAEEKSLDTVLIIKTLSKGWIKESYLDTNDSMTHLFIKVE